MTTDVDTTAPAFLRDKYAIIGIGETEYTRGSGVTTRKLATWAIRNAMEDAGIVPGEIDGMMSYSGNDSTPSPPVAADLGIRLNFYTDIFGGGSSTENLVGLAIGAIEAGMCKTVVIYRAMNGFTEVRIGGTGARAAAPLAGDRLHNAAYGWFSAGQNFSQTFMRAMHDYNLTPEQLAHVKVAHSRHASQNPKAYYKNRMSVEDVLNSRMIVKPLHLLDCCVETDNGTAIIVTSVERAYDYKNMPARILGVVGRCCKPGNDITLHYQYGPVSQVAAHYAKDIIWPNSGHGPDEMDLTGSYDAFTFTTALQLQDYGFCPPGEIGEYITSGAIQLGGERPNNTSGGHLCEVYTHGMNMVIENVRQLRGTVDDYCPVDADGVRQHTYDYETPGPAEGACRQKQDVNLTANLGWAYPAAASALVMRKG